MTSLTTRLEYFKCMFNDVNSYRFYELRLIIILQRFFIFIFIIFIFLCLTPIIDNILICEYIIKK